MEETRWILVKELAVACGGRLVSPATTAVRRVNTVDSLEEAGPESVSWISSPKYAKDLARCRAAIVVGPKALLSENPMGLIVEDPELAMAKVLQQFWIAPASPSTGIHPTALVDPSAKISPGAAIGPFCVIGAGSRVSEGAILHECVSIGCGVRIGADARLFPQCVVADRCVIGERVILHPGVVVGADGFGYVFREGGHLRLPHIGTVIIEDDVEVGPNTVIDRAKFGATRIGRGTKIDALVMIAHNVQIGPHCIVIAQAAIAGSARLGAGVVLAGQAGVIQGVRIADRVQIGAQSGVMSDITDNGAAVLGMPAHDARATMKQFARLRQLPKLFEEFTELARRVSELEASANHRRNG